MSISGYSGYVEKVSIFPNRKVLVEFIKWVGTEAVEFATGEKVIVSVAKLKLECGHFIHVKSTGYIPEYEECKECVK
jgi:hypothetical protein